MKKNARKSTALVSLVLVPLNLLGLGFVGGCDSGDDNASSTVSSANTEDDGDSGDFAEADDGFNLDPVENNGDVGPVLATTRPLAQSSFAAQPAHPATYSASHYHHTGGGVVFLPIPYRTGYTPPYRPMFRSSSGVRSSPSFSRSSSSGVSRSSSSSGISRGGFGSSGHSASASS